MISCYGLSYLGGDRKARVTSRFETVGVSLSWCDPIPPDDPRCSNLLEPRAASCMYGHLGMIRRFLDEGSDFGVFCEDDVFLRRDFALRLPEAVDLYVKHDVSVMLLGYLLDYQLPPGLHCVWHDLWGTQMYLLGRDAALKVLELFSEPSIVTGPFSADWTITKIPGARALSPMLAVEEGGHGYQQRCRDAQYNPDLHF